MRPGKTRRFFGKEKNYHDQSGKRGHGIMKPGKLYVKIFLHFLAFLVIAQIAISGFFAMLMGKEFRDRHHHYNNAKMKMAQELIVENIKRHPSIPIEENRSLQKLLFRMGKVFHAMICLAETDRGVLVKSFRREIPERYLKKIKEIEANKSDEGWFHRVKRKHHKFYLNDTLRINGRTATLHMLFAGHIPPYSILWFAVGLIGIGVAVALMIIPVSRQITRPVNTLAESARKIAMGDLTARADVKGKDEIGRLGRAFNAMAEKLEKMVRSGKEMTAQISHELRTPLARMRIAIELLKDKKDSGEIEEHLLDMEEDINELDELIGRILELSKLDIKETVSASEAFSPAELLEEILKKSEPLMQNKNIDIRADIDSRREIFGNRSSFYTVLSNIVDNARKFSPVNGNVRASVVMENDSLLIVVSNSVASIDERDLDKIFEPFYQISPGEQKGAGLGLAIARKIVERHKGKISAVKDEEDIAIRIEIPT